MSRIDIAGHLVFVGRGGGDWAADRPTLVLLHGAGMNRTVWVLQARYLARHGYNVIAPDLPGHGASGGAALASIEAQSLWLWGLLDRLAGDPRLSFDRLILAGHSMGSLTVIEAAAARPTAISGILLCGCGYPMRVSEALLSASLHDLPSAIDMITLFGHAYASRIGHNPMPGIPVLQSASALLERNTPGVLHTDLSACDAWRGLEAASAELYGIVPVCLIAGDEDRMTPASSSQEVSRLLKASSVQLAQCGHMMMAEQPEVLLEAMREALAGFASRPSQ